MSIDSFVMDNTDIKRSKMEDDEFDLSINPLLILIQHDNVLKER